MNPALIPLILAAGRIATSPQVTGPVTQNMSALEGEAMPLIQRAGPMIGNIGPQIAQKSMQFMGAFPPSKMGNPVASAISLLKNKLQPEDINTIGQFAEKVERGQDKGNL